MELIYEIFFEIYLELMMYMVPEKGGVSRRYRFLAILIATVVLIGVLALFLWGFFLILEEKNWLGLLPIVLASVISLAQIIAGFYLYCKKGK
jgi:hypothetical protein